MDELQDRIATWARAVFGKFNRVGLAVHLLEELNELQDGINDLDSDVVETEAADMVILLFQLADHYGFSLREAIERKHKINLTRRWKAPDNQGVIRHV